MKYAGSITIMDDAGNAVFEQNLSVEEIVQILIDAHNRETIEAPKDELPPESAARIGGVDVFVTHTPPVASSVSQEYVPEKRKKGQKVCKKCGKPGHMQKTCPENQTRTFDLKAAAPTPAFNAASDGDMGAITFLDVKELQSKGKPSMVIASQKRLNMREVGIAMRSSTYEEYKRIRKN